MIRPNSTQVLQILLVFVIVANCIIHFCSPAYREYKNNVADLQDKYSRFEQHIAGELLPVLRLFAEYKTTNGFVSSSVQLTPTNVHSSVVISQSVGGSNTPQNQIDAAVFSVGCDFFFTFGGWHYAVGDLFYGSPVVSITPTMIRTTDCFFTIRNNNKEIVNAGRNDSL